jgi:hypothetical protein
MIQFPLTPPAEPAPAAMTIRARETVAQSRSPFSGKRQVYEHQGGMWQMEFTLPILTEAEWREWSAFLVALRGVRGTFLMGDPVRSAPQGAGGGAPVVDGAGQTGLTLATRGWPASTLVLKAGDYIQLGSASATHLHMLTADATSDAAGLVTLDLWPRLRTTPADGGLIVVSNTVGQWHLATNLNGWDYRPARLSEMSFKCVEAL